MLTTLRPTQSRNADRLQELRKLLLVNGFMAGSPILAHLEAEEIFDRFIEWLRTEREFQYDSTDYDS